ncbi:MAG TPA: hypothetical protein VFD82_16100 [Planctomycetota bacterium]|nr:hypothetical protein [Planctomycetota bacterium]
MRVTARRFLAAAVLSAVGTAQSTLVVPVTHATIQGAIAATVNGDTVLVLPGTYFERIDFLGKAIVVRSTGGAAATTIDGSSGGPVVTFATNEPPAAQLIGFTITHGLGATVSSPLLLARSTAGGIQCVNASPTIRACVITANQGGAGGPPVTGSFSAGAGGPGGILASESALHLIDCAITNNVGGQGGIGTVSTSNAGRGGAGGAYFAFTVAGSAPEILRCTFTDNGGGSGGTSGVAFGVGGRGGVGGIELHVTVAVGLTQCGIRGNTGGNGGTAAGASGLGGLGGHGGFDISSQLFVPVPVQMGSCAVVGNVGGNGGGGPNASGGHGGGSTGPTRFTGLGCTFAGNATGTPLASGTGTGGVVGGGGVSTFALQNCVLWGNTRLGAPSDLYVSGIVGLVNSSDLGATTGTILGTGNLSTDPLFVNLASGDVHLTAPSPCRHTGTPAANAPLFDLDGDPRIVGPATDMGADEWDGLTGSREDLALDLAVNGGYAPGVVASTAVAGNLVALRVQSPGGTFAGSFTVVLAEPWLPPIEPVGPVAFPELHVTFGAAWLATLPGGVGPAGLTLAAVWPPGLAGFALRLQAVAISPVARNTLFAATAARDLIL